MKKTKEKRRKEGGRRRSVIIICAGALLFYIPHPASLILCMYNVHVVRRIEDVVQNFVHMYEKV